MLTHAYLSYFQGGKGNDGEDGKRGLRGYKVSWMLGLYWFILHTNDCIVYSIGDVWVLSIYSVIMYYTIVIVY